jgi:GNAT superfamily N-acetyltransferase
LKIKNPRLLDIAPLLSEWKGPYTSDKQRRRAKKYRGSRTFYAVGDIEGEGQRGEGEDAMTELGNPRLLHGDYLIRKMREKQKDVKPEDKPREDKRLEAVRKIVRKQKGLNKAAKLLDKEYTTKESDVDPEELRIGIEIEKEHTSDEAAAKEIALDHLHEVPDYYTRLVAMEEDAKRAKIRKAAKIILDINVGDTLLVGRFKNKPIIVKDIGTDANGQPTINGRKLLSARIKKLMPEKKKPATASAASKKLRKGKNTSKAALKMRKKASEIGEIEYNKTMSLDILNNAISRAEGHTKEASEEVEYKIVSGKKRYKPTDGESKEYSIRRAIAKINGLHAGSAKIVRTSDDDNVFESLNVVDEHRGKGIGRELAERLLKDADKRGAESITLRANPYMDEPVDQEKLIEFYKTLGFESTDDDGRMIRKKASTLVVKSQNTQEPMPPEMEKIAEEVEQINTGLDTLNKVLSVVEGK